jgi:branched-chain amino acid transport system permease protein
VKSREADFRPPLWTAIPRGSWPFVLSVILAAVLYFWVAPRIGGFGADLLMNSGIAIILATSLTVVNGFTGQFSIGHAGFMSLGGYTAAAVVYYSSYKLFGDFDFHGGLLSWTGVGAYVGPWLTKGDGLFIVACICGAIVAGIAGWIVGLPSLRLRGDYLAIVTLGFGEIVRVIIQGTPDQLDATSTDPSLADLSLPRQLTHLGGALGFSGAPAYTTVFWVWLAVALTLAAIIRLKQSSYGRALLSVREDEIASSAMGVNITKYKVRAFVFSAFFAGLAGALYAMKVGTINAGELAFQKSFDIVIMVVLGGLGSVSGAAVAAIILTLLPELLRAPPSLWPWGLLVAAAIAVLIVLFAPRKRGPLLTLLGTCIGWELLRWGARLAGISLSDYRMVIYALALIVIMIVRPQGLFGVREIWDYLVASWQFWRRKSKGDPRRPLYLAIRSVRLLGIVFLLLGSCAFLTLFIPRGRVGPRLMVGPVLAIILVCVITGAANIVFAIFLKKREFWAVVASLIVASMQLLFALPGGIRLAMAWLTPGGSNAGTPLLIVTLVVGLVILALAQLVYHLALSFKAIQYIPLEQQRGFEPFMIHPIPPPPPNPPSDLPPV